MTDKILIDRSVLKQALEALGDNEWGTAHHDDSVSAALRAALEQELVEQEPDWTDSKTLPTELWKNPLLSFQERLQIADGSVHWHREVADNLRSRLYIHPQPPRQPLTDEEIDLIDANTHFHESPEWERRFARAIERAHGIGGEA